MATRLTALPTAPGCVSVFKDAHTTDMAGAGPFNLKPGESATSSP